MLHNVIIPRLHTDAPAFGKLQPSDYFSIVTLIEKAAKANGERLSEATARHHRLNFLYAQAKEVVKDCQMSAGEKDGNCKALELYHLSDLNNPVCTFYSVDVT